MGTRPSTVGEIGEFGLIEAVTSGLPTHPAIELGPGDDAAVVRLSAGRVVASTDLLCESVHFRRDWSSAHDVGHKAAAANLADIAAMGAVPTALLVGMTVGAAVPVTWVRGLMAGLQDEAEAAGAAIAGGDVSAGEQIVIAVTALGDLGERAALTRSGASVGDRVACAGDLGVSAAGLQLLGAGRAGSHPEVVARHRRPRPPYAAGPVAAQLGATALIDVSDGLIADAGHLAAASKVAVELSRASLQPSRELVAAAGELGADPVTLMLSGGEDHALLATFPAGPPLPAPWRVIGRVIQGSGVTVDGRPWTGTPGWRHFGPGGAG